MKSLALWLVLPFVFAGIAGAGEREETDRLVAEGMFGDCQTEVVLWDKTRVDISTATHAIEVDWASKWAEGVGQALYYSAVTGKKPGLVLLTKPGEERFVYRASILCVKHEIRLWVVEVKGVNNAQAD